MESLPRVHEMAAASAQIALGGTVLPEVRPLSDGRVLVLDNTKHSLRLTDPTLSSLTPIVDQTTSPPGSFPVGTGHLIAGKADTTWVLDLAAGVYRVLDPQGVVVRQVPARSKYTRAMSPVTSTLSFDGEGHLLFIDSYLGGRPIPGAQMIRDSQVVRRLDIAFDVGDSIGVIRRSATASSAAQPQVVRPGEPATLQAKVAPVAAGDAWAVTSDGEVALIRAADFHIEWIDGANRRRQSAPVPWPWHRYTQAEKDSITARVTRALTKPSVPTFTSPSGISVSAPASIEIQNSAGAMPDMEPAFVAMSAKGDAAGNVWIRLGAHVAGVSEGPVDYGILDRSGQLIDRVRFPSGRLLSGFGPDGTVYMVAPGKTNGIMLERYQYQKP